MSSTPRKRVRGYHRADGTYVRGHYRSRPSGQGSTCARRGAPPTPVDLGELLGALFVLMLLLTALAHAVG